MCSFSKEIECFIAMFLRLSLRWLERSVMSSLMFTHASTWVYWKNKITTCIYKNSVVQNYDLPMAKLDKSHGSGNIYNVNVRLNMSASSVHQSSDHAKN